MIDSTQPNRDTADEPTEAIPAVDRRTLLAATAGLAGFAGCLGDSSGSGGGSCDEGFVVEGPDGNTHCVAAVESDRSITEYYGYDTETQNSSALADGIEAVDATVSFVYRNTSTGDLSLVVVHDSPDGGSGGSVAMTFEGVDQTEWLVKDDPEPRSSSEVYESPGDTSDGSFSAIWGWSGSSSLTDGGAIGSLGDSVDITLTHHQEATVGETTTSRDGIDRWLFVDGTDLDSPIELASFDEGSGDVSVRLSTTS